MPPNLPGSGSEAGANPTSDGWPHCALSCVSLHFYERCEDCVEEDCGLHKAMVEVRDAQLAVLESKSVADLL